MTKRARFDADEIMRPLEMKCVRCNGTLTVYPSQNPQGVGYCENCSPKWLKSFAIFGMNEQRKRMHLQPI